MIVQCPECQTKYNLPDSKISTSGTKVRCSRCTHTFTAFPSGAAQEPEPAPQPRPEARPEPRPEPEPAPKPEASRRKAEPEPEDDLGLGDLGLDEEASSTAGAAKSGQAGKTGLGADFDEDDFLASLGDLGDLGGTDPFGAKKDSDEPSFSDDFLKSEPPASAKGGRKPAESNVSLGSDEDLFSGLDDLLGDTPKTKTKARPGPADDLGLDGIDFGDEPAGSARDRKKPAAPEPEAAEEAGAGLGGEPVAASGEQQGQPGEVEQEVDDEDFEAALRNLSMDLDEDAEPAPGKSASGKTDLDQAEADAEAPWPGFGSVTDDDLAAVENSAAPSLNLDEAGPASFDAFDEKPRKEKKGGALKLLLFLLLFMLLLLAGGAAAIHYLGLWSSLPPWAQDLARTVRLPVDGGMAKPSEDQVRLLSLENIRQYTVQNDKAGQVFVIEGKVVNNFPAPRELVRVQASLYDQAGGVVVSKDITAGNTVSLFQLQIMSPQEIETALASNVGIQSNNTDVQTGESVPFMAVFFNAPESVAEFGVKVIEAREPAK